MTLYVDSSAAPGGSGLSWTSAFWDLQDALQFSNSSTDIWIADGSYRPDRGTNARTASFVIPPGVRVFGGFRGGETSLSDRLPGVHVPRLSGDVGVPGDPVDNSFHVVRIGAGAGVTLDGLHICDGNANGAAFPDDSGGGLLIDGSSPTIVSCVIAANSGRFGAGLFARAGTPLIVSCEFRQNVASQDGGGAVLRSGGIVRGSSFDGNSSVFGGGLLACCGTTRVEDSIFRGNFANKGGGLNTPIGSLVLVRVGLFGNSAIEGGGVYASAPGMVIASSRLGNNTAQLGGGIYLTAQAQIVNGVFTRNFATASGGAIYSSAALSLQSSTLWSNTALNFGGAVYSIAGNPLISNSILWANSDSTGSGQGAQFTRVTGAPQFVSCCVQGWNGLLSGVACIATNPLIQDPSGPDGVPGTIDDDMALAPSSPCVDAGINTMLPADSADVDGNGDTSETLPLDVVASPRVAAGPGAVGVGLRGPAVVDMGAVEFITSFCSGDANGDGMVDAADLSVLLSQFGGSTTPGSPPDFNGDGLVNGADLSVLLSTFGTVC